jgi:ABC-2 type transport system permease protein
MNFNRVRVIIDKEWAEVFKHRMVLVTISIMPIIFTIMPLVIIYALTNTGTPLPDGTMPEMGSADVPPQFLEACGDVTATECMQIFMTNQFMLMFMMMPLMIPTAIAAYSIVGEKTTRSLEPLLATPITTFELLAGKALAAVIPATIITWVCFSIYLLLLPAAGGTPGLLRYVTGPIWLVAVLVLGPLMSIAAVNLAVIVSSRVNDPRVAEQMAAVLVVPLVMLLFAQLAGLVILNISLMLAAVLFVIFLDFGLVYAGARLFQRETILTRWK